MAFQTAVLAPEYLRPERTLRDGQYRLIWTKSRGACVKVDVEMSDSRVTFHSPRGTKSYFLFDARVTASGEILTLEPLFSDMPEHTRDAARFLRENLRLFSHTKTALALQVFVALNVSEAGEIGYSVGGASELM